MAATTTIRSRVDSGPRSARPRAFRPGWLILAGAVVVAVVWADGYRRRPYGAASGTALLGTTERPAGESSTLRLGTFNIHGGRGRDGRRDLERTARCLAGLDLAGLNEVYGHYAWEREDQVAWLGHRLGQAFLFTPAEERWWHYRFGNAVLSSLPVRNWQQIPLPRVRSRSFRNLVLLSAEYHDRTIHVVVTHIDRDPAGDHDEQLRVAGQLFLALAEPAVLMGDLNAAADEPALARLLKWPGVHDAVGEVRGETLPRRIDWILTRGMRTVDAGLVDTGASDHPCVWAEVDIEPVPMDAGTLLRRATGEDGPHAVPRTGDVDSDSAPAARRPSPAESER